MTVDVVNVVQNKQLGRNRRVDQLLAGSRNPQGTVMGIKNQFYLRTTGDVFMNMDGKTSWIHIHEV